MRLTFCRRGIMANTIRVFAMIHTVDFDLWSRPGARSYRRGYFPNRRVFRCYGHILYTFRLSEALANDLSAPAVRKVYRIRVP